MAQDIKPSRLDAAKQAISRMVEKLSDDKVGLIVFAGDAYVQLPITTDYSSAKLFLSGINTDIVPIQGTAIGTAIDLAAKSFTPDTKTIRTMRLPRLKLPGKKVSTYTRSGWDWHKEDRSRRREIPDNT